METQKLLTTSGHLTPSYFLSTNQRAYAEPSAPHTYTDNPPDHYYSQPVQLSGPLPKNVEDLRENREFVICPFCHEHILTVNAYTESITPCVITTVMCLLFVMVGLWICIPCAFIPLCLNNRQRVEHFCPKCDKLIYVYKP